MELRVEPESHVPVYLQIVEQLRSAGLKTLVPKFPRQNAGTLDAHRFLASTWDTRPGREYNVLVADQLAQILR